MAWLQCAWVDLNGREEFTSESSREKTAKEKEILKKGVVRVRDKKGLAWTHQLTRCRRRRSRRSRRRSKRRRRRWCTRQCRCSTNQLKLAV